MGICLKNMWVRTLLKKYSIDGLMAEESLDGSRDESEEAGRDKGDKGEDCSGGPVVSA